MALALALLLLLCLPACTRDETIAGRWRCVSAQARGLELDAGSLGDESAVLTLEPDGRGSISRCGREGALSWSRTGDVLEMEIGGRTYSARLEGELLLLEADEGVSLSFLREESIPEATEPPAAEERSWYGWWSVSGSEGQMPETWYDCCAALEQDGEELLLILWDEDSSRDAPLAQIWLEPEDEAGRRVRSIRGWFLLQELGEGAWTIDLDESPLVLSGRHESVKERFDYQICLRPWGDDWSEAEEHLPFRWRDWYLPRIEAGAPMPDSIG